MIWSIIVGGLIGWLAGKLMNSKGGLLRNILLGIVGSGVGNWLAGAIGLVAGFAWKRLPQLRLDLRLPVSVLLGHFVGSMVITSMALRIFYGYAWSVLLVRIPNALILSAVNTVLLRILLENRSLMKLAKK